LANNHAGGIRPKAIPFHASLDKEQQARGVLAFAFIVTLASFWVAETNIIWTPHAPILLAVLAIAQMGVHLVFFLHISSAPDSLNNILTLAFGVFVVSLVVFGSMIIMNNFNANMMTMQR